MEGKYFVDENTNADSRKSYKEDIEQFISYNLENASVKRRAYFLKNLKANKEKLRSQYIKMLGFPLNRYKSGKKANGIKEFCFSEANYNVYRVTVKAFFNVNISGYYYEPAHVKEKSPLIIVLHGGDGTPELISGLLGNTFNYNNMLKRACRFGSAVFAPQLLLWDKSKYRTDYNRTAIDESFKQLGGSITAFEVACISRCIDYFFHKPEIDNDKIGIIGLSYGGMYANAVAAFDKRIKSTLSSCFFNDRTKYNKTDWSFKNAANIFCDAEIAGLIAPRPLYIEVGADDELFDCKGAVSEYKNLELYYKELDCLDKLRFEVFKGGHELDNSEKGYEFFFKHLLNT